MASFISSGTSKLLVSPIDTMKKLLKLQAFTTIPDITNKYKGIMICFISIARNKGLFVFYRGT